VSPRYAVYYAPGRDSPWWAFGAAWLGRDEERNLPLPRPVVAGMDADGMDAITREPRRYGFHATLKAPFRLRDGATRDDLHAALQSLAAKRRAVALGQLAPIAMDGFVALVPAADNPPLQALAAACVTELDALRAPPTPAERERRRLDPADSRGAELFERYGYPHVLERFRFHMTLTGPVEPALARQLVAQLARPAAQLNAQQPLVLDRLCLFVEPAQGEPFRRIDDLELPS
jgi:putative phosphonate metabolism protein